MDVLAHALKNKLKGLKITIEPAHSDPHDDQTKLKEEDRAPNVLDAHDDMGPNQDPLSADSDDAEISHLKGLSSGGPIGRGPIGLGEHAKLKMKEKIASIEARKKQK